MHSWSIDLNKKKEELLEKENENENEKENHDKILAHIEKLETIWD